MSNYRGYWLFDGDVHVDFRESYPGIRESLRILLENLISSKMLLPRSIEKIPLEYNTVDELMDLIEKSGYLETASEFDIAGDTVMYTPKGEEVYEDIICLQGFRTSQQNVGLVARTDHWLPMMMDRKTYEFSWNLDLHRLNYYRIPALIKKLETSLPWTNAELLCWDYTFASWQGGYDFFLEDSIVIREYNESPNPDFDLEAYLEAIEKARKKYSKSYNK